jgi:hypothetical protein
MSVLTDEQIEGFKRLAKGKPNMRLLLESHEALRKDAELGRLVRGLSFYQSLEKNGKGRWIVCSYGNPVSHVTYDTPEEALEAWAADNAKAAGLMKDDAAGC